MVNFPAGDWITLAEAAPLLGVSKRRVQALVKDDRIPARKVGNAFLVLRSDVTAFRPKPRGRPKDQDVKPAPKKKGRGRASS